MKAKRKRRGACPRLSLGKHTFARSRPTPPLAAPCLMCMGACLVCAVRPGASKVVAAEGTIDLMPPPMVPAHAPPQARPPPSSLKARSASPPSTRPRLHSSTFEWTGPRRYAAAPPSALLHLPHPRGDLVCLVRVHGHGACCIVRVACARGICMRMRICLIYRLCMRA